MLKNCFDKTLVCNNSNDLIEYSSNDESAVKNRNRFYLIFKRSFDIVSSLFAIIALFFVFLIIALLIKLDDGGPVFYKQIRIGRDGKKFKMLKFRSMKVNADDLEECLSEDEYEQYKKEFKLDDDPRITRIGKLLRKTSMDELPQIYNIFKGDMSVIGPRPVISDELEYYGDSIDMFLSVRPGLTGYWQAYARNDAGYLDNKRQQMELYYVKNISFVLDLKVFLKTIGTVFTGRGAK